MGVVAAPLRAAVHIRRALTLARRKCLRATAESFEREAVMKEGGKGGESATPTPPCLPLPPSADAAAALALPLCVPSSLLAAASKAVVMHVVAAEAREERRNPWVKFPSPPPLLLHLAALSPTSPSIVKSCVARKGRSFASSSPANAPMAVISVQASVCLRTISGESSW